MHATIALCDFVKKIVLLFKTVERDDVNNAKAQTPLLRFVVNLFIVVQLVEQQICNKSK